MPDIIIPVPPITTVQKERRCTHTVCSNNLDMEVSASPTIPELAAKYGVRLVCVDEPQDANRDRSGPREAVADKELPMEEVLSRNYTVQGMTLPGYVIMAFFNEIIDAYKGD